MGFVINDFVIFFNCINLMNIKVDRRVKFKCVIVCCSFWVFKYNINFYMNLVNEDI